MTDERALYETDRDGWLAYVAPSMARKLTDEPDATLADTWSRIPRDYQAAVVPHLTDDRLKAVWASIPREKQMELWALLPETQRVRIRTLRSGKN